MTTRNYRRVYQKDPPSRNSILRWKKKFLETGGVLNTKSPGRVCTSDVDVERVSEAFLHSPRRSVRSAARKLDLPVSTVHKVLGRISRLYAYKVQIVQALEPDDRHRRMDFATDMLRRIDDDAEFLNRIMFSYEACFYYSGIVNHHNVLIW
ncbi:hypothetical protein AVEN_133942-1 [Araneus ventricosus]|uniref:Uncharacterized protein n=1 Tax=Araneus ventricosus TaxID=182803 RepID=A0A4Y2VR51_ARAVE|nr:hypothetical protein AVEN_133942-1 [Araneus ventricosus]